MSRRGVLLLEILLALAMFVAAGIAVGAAVRSAVMGWDRASEREMAADLAWSAMARIEAGISSVATENGPAPDAPGTSEGAGWALEIETAGTAHAGVVLVEIGAVRTRDDLPLGGAVYVARQLVRVSEDAGQRAVEFETPTGASLFGEGGS